MGIANTIELGFLTSYFKSNSTFSAKKYAHNHGY